MGVENILSLIGGLAIGDFERIADHCSNIATTVMQMKNGSIGQHGYKEFADREGAARETPDARIGKRKGIIIYYG